MTIAICCHNSAARLPETLRHLREQVVPAGIDWEVVLIDNGSTDDTVLAAKRAWSGMETVALRIISEPRLGLSYARHRAFAEAAFPLVAFVDDDNWLAPDWVARAVAVAAEHPEAGAIGGFISPRLSVDPPGWFERYRGDYATSREAGEARDVSESWGYLFGAGLIVRKAAWEDIVHLGFSSLLTDRKGKSLVSGGDSETCFALRMAGWRLWYESTLRMEHCIPAGRIRWTYVCGLHHGFGAADVILDLYRQELGGVMVTRGRKFRRYMKDLLNAPRLCVMAALGKGEGQHWATWVHYTSGQVKGLIHWTDKEAGFRRFAAACQARRADK
jgi:glycosyltransferase involved in cell wall biosynthesis